MADSRASDHRQGLPALTMPPFSHNLLESRGIGILPMVHGLEGIPNAESCVGDLKPIPR